jgi:hypothetical protein
VGILLIRDTRRPRTRGMHLICGTPRIHVERMELLLLPMLL